MYECFSVTTWIGCFPCVSILNRRGLNLWHFIQNTVTLSLQRHNHMPNFLTLWADWQYPQCIKLDTCETHQNHVFCLKKPLWLRKEKAKKVGDLYTYVWEFMFSRPRHVNFKFRSYCLDKVAQVDSAMLENLHLDSLFE